MRTSGEKERALSNPLASGQRAATADAGQSAVISIEIISINRCDEKKSRRNGEKERKRKEMGKEGDDVASTKATKEKGGPEANATVL